jgi:hypothetical protein
MAVNETSNSAAAAAVNASNTAAGPAIWASSPRGRAVVGVCEDGVPLWGQTHAGRAVVGAVDGGGGAGVWGETTNGTGVVGKDNAGGDGVVGEGRRGVVGKSPSYQGVYGWSERNAGVVGVSERFHAVFAESHDPNNAGLFATNSNGGFAAVLDGRVRINGVLTVTGDIQLANADCAEDFDVCDLESTSPGTVLVVAEDGVLRASQHPYDRRVAGVVSGAGSYRPGLVLDRRRRESSCRPVALVGKVYCKVDAAATPIRVGDLLTTSTTPGHAMRVDDPRRAFGAVLGKALAPLSGGVGMVPVLVALQ